MDLAKALSEEERRVLLDHGTDPAYCGNLLDNKKQGTYACRLCTGSSGGMRRRLPLQQKGTESAPDAAAPSPRLRGEPGAPAGGSPPSAGPEWVNRSLLR